MDGLDGVGPGVSSSPTVRGMAEQALAGRVAVVTGGAGGIGRAISVLMATEGATVHVVDIDPERTEATVDEIDGAVGHVLM